MGRINFKYKNIEIIHRIKSGNYVAKEFKNIPYEICALTNGDLLCAERAQLTFYNKNFEIIREVKTIKNQLFNGIFSVTHNQKNIFFTDYSFHRVCKTNFNFDEFETIGSEGDAPDQFYYPFGVFYRDNFVYVCDRDNKRIKKLNTDLKLEMLFSLNYKPKRIKISSETACIQSYEYSNPVYFHDAKTFVLKFKCDVPFSIMGLINERFYLYCYTSPNKYFMYLYDSCGTLLDEIKTNGFDHRQNNNYCGLELIESKITVFSQKHEINKLIFV